MTIRDHKDFHRRADGADIEVRRDKFDGFQVTIFRGPNLKHFDLSREQAAALRDGLIHTLGEAL